MSDLTSTGDVVQGARRVRGPTSGDAATADWVVSKAVAPQDCDESTAQAFACSTVATAVVCTRNRGERVAATVTSILASEGISFELLVVDQSTDDRTARALEPFHADPRFRYERSSESGLGRARNTGLGLARGEIVAFTDDDVTVPPTWLATMVRVIEDHPRVAVAFCNVDPAPHDETTGFVPEYRRRGSVEITSVAGKCRARGIGAGIAVRRDAVRALGGFDPLLGAGSLFASCEDGDIALRALLFGWHIFETDEVSVLHDGFRTWEEGRELTRRDWYGIGAAYAKPIRAGRLSALVVVLYEGVWVAAFRPLLYRGPLRRPRGLKRAWYFWQGFVTALRLPVDSRTLRFTERAAPRGS